jgi:spermidine synthase
VENGRRGRSLRIDGTYASFYAPGSSLTGSVWDALVAPLLWLPPPKRRRVLILGLGGGSAARLVRSIAPRARIVGVERSAEVIRAARRWFDLDALDVEVIREDARHFLQTSRRQFDLVIEDVFVGPERKVRKPDWVLEDGLQLAARRLRRGGLLVVNTIDETAEVARVLREIAPALLRIDVEDFDNRVLAAGPRGLTGRALRSAVGAHRVMSATLPQLSFRRI